MHASPGSRRDPERPFPKDPGEGTGPTTPRPSASASSRSGASSAGRMTSTARVFLVCSNTISNWQRAADPLAKAVGSLVKPTPPVSRLADIVRATAQILVRCGWDRTEPPSRSHAPAGGCRRARSAGSPGSRSSRTVPPEAGPPKPYRPVVARFVHHTWMMDVTEIPALLGGQVFHLAGVFDACSRAPLALQLLPRRPRACDMARLLKAAARAFGAPKYLITDLGGEFRGRAFTKAVARHGIKQRFASALNIHATARLERFWRTLKDTASLRLQLSLTIEDLERRLETPLAYYLFHRPHQGLHGATPAEAFLGVEPACASAVSPPRGRPGEGPSRAAVHRPAPRSGAPPPDPDSRSVAADQRPRHPRVPDTRAAGLVCLLDSSSRLPASVPINLHPRNAPPDARDSPSKSSHPPLPAYRRARACAGRRLARAVPDREQARGSGGGASGAKGPAEPKEDCGRLPINVASVSPLPTPRRAPERGEPMTATTRGSFTRAPPPSVKETTRRARERDRSRRYR